MRQAIWWQRLEGALLFLTTTYVYHQRGGSWLWFVIGLVAIDLSMAGYLAGPRVGAWLYNLGHSFVTPILIYLAARSLDSSALTLLAAIWFAHIGADRALGFGLKSKDSFKETHLGRIG